MGVECSTVQRALAFETVKRHFSILADRDEVAVRVTPIATPFPAAIVQRLGKEERSFVAPLFVARPNVGNAQVKEAIHSFEIGRGFEEDLWLIGSWTTTGIENDPGDSQLDVAGILRLDHVPAKDFS